MMISVKRLLQGLATLAVLPVLCLEKPGPMGGEHVIKLSSMYAAAEQEQAQAVKEAQLGTELKDEIDESVESPTLPIPGEEVQAGEEAVADQGVMLLDTDTAAVSIGDSGPDPKRVVLSPGTTVVWKNSSKSPVQVHFIGKAISTTCKAPRGFAIGAKGVYSSSPIAPGGIASLCFLEPELYVYEVRAPLSGSASGRSSSTVGAVQIVRE